MLSMLMPLPGNASARFRLGQFCPTARLQAASCFSPFGTSASRGTARLSGGSEAGTALPRAPSSGACARDPAVSAASFAAAPPATPQRAGPVASTTGGRGWHTARKLPDASWLCQAVAMLAAGNLA